MDHLNGGNRHAPYPVPPGLRSGLVCAGANVDSSEDRDDGYLTAEEIGWLDLTKVELVFLSACKSALGVEHSGEGMMGLQWAFHQAGARTVISSLWNVRDQDARALALDFYVRHLQQGKGKLEAFRGAQLRMLEENRALYGEGRPRDWGAFILSGDWR